MDLTRDFEKKKKKRRACTQSIPLSCWQLGTPPPCWQARAGLFQWKALWLLAGTPLVWLNGCQLCQGDGRAGVSPLIETSLSSEPLTFRTQDLCQSTSNLFPNRWKQPQVTWRTVKVMQSQPMTTSYRSRVNTAQSRVISRRVKFSWPFLHTFHYIVINIKISNQATETELLGFHLQTLWVTCDDLKAVTPLFNEARDFCFCSSTSSENMFFFICLI